MLLPELLGKNWYKRPNVKGSNEWQTYTKNKLELFSVLRCIGNIPKAVIFGVAKIGKILNPY